MFGINIAIASLCLAAVFVANSPPISLAYAGFGLGYVGLAWFYFGVAP